MENAVAIVFGAAVASVTAITCTMICKGYKAEDVARVLESSPLKLSLALPTA